MLPRARRGRLIDEATPRRLRRARVTCDLMSAIGRNLDFDASPRNALSSKVILDVGRVGLEPTTQGL